MSATQQSLHEQALHKRKLANDARRVANLMHQPSVKAELEAQAASLEQEARQLELLAEQFDRDPDQKLD
jgi:hypothetical protein